MSPETSPDAALRRLNLDTRRIQIGAALVAAGGILSFAGMILGGMAVRAAAQDWIGQLERPPSQLAKQKWQQLVAAGSAGADAWKQQPAVTGGGAPPAV